MAINPINGPIIEKAYNDENGPVGTTSGGVKNKTASTEPVQPYREPTAGSPPGQPGNPHYNPLDEAFFPRTAVGPGEG